MNAPKEKKYSQSLVVFDYSSLPSSPVLTALLVHEDIGLTVSRTVDDYSSPRSNSDLCFVFLADAGADIEKPIAIARRRFKKKPILLIVIDQDGDQSYSDLREIADRCRVDCSVYAEVGEEVIDRIKSFYRSVVSHNANNPVAVRPKRKIDLSELADRIDLAAAAISDLRINSASGPVSDLRGISSELRDFRTKTEQPSASHFDKKLNEALFAVAKLFDFIDNSRMASIVVCGATAILGCSGINAVMCMGLTLAAWQGQEAYLEALTRIFANRGKSKQVN